MKTTTCNTIKTEDEKNFEIAKEKILSGARQRQGIGTLGEKTLHAIIKNYYCPDEKFQEVKIGKYFADIYKDGMIIEIQTRNFDKLRKKLEVFLQENHVTIVYPIPKEKWIIWVDPVTGETKKPRKSPVCGTEYTAFKELYKIKLFLNNPRLHIKLLLMDMEEYRLQNGWSRDGKKGSERYDRIPLKLQEETNIDDVRDYIQFVPNQLEEFTSKDFAKETKTSLRQAQTVINILCYLGCIIKTGKSGRSNLYRGADW